MRRLSGIVPLVIGVFFLVLSYSHSLGGLTDPGPGLWPLLISAVIILSSLVLLVTERDSNDYEHFTTRVRFVGFGLLSLAVFILLFAGIGFILPGFLTFVFWLRFLGGESWRFTLVFSAVCTAGFYIVFRPLLGVPLPNDIVTLLWRG